MRKYRTEQTVYNKEVLEKWACDRCGVKLEEKSYNAFCPDWFQCDFGNTFPEGGSGTRFELDLCEDCSVAAVVALRQNGFNVRETEWDW